MTSFFFNTVAFSIVSPWLRQATKRAAWCTGWLLIALSMGVARAQAGAGSGQPSPSLATVLRADGTIRAGVRGSFSAAGYRLLPGPGGQPSFEPNGTQAVQGTAGAGDTGWADNFAVNGAGNPVEALVADGNGNLYIGGSFTTVAGIAAKGVAKWNGTAWSALSRGYDGFTGVRALALDSRGTLYAGGTFQYAGASSRVNYIAKWNGQAWSGLTGGVNGFVSALVVDGNDNLYVGGSFNQVGSVFINQGIAAPSRVAKWNGTAWSAVGQGPTTTAVYGDTPTISALVLDGNNTLYAGGNFITMSGVPANAVAKWNGAAWSALGSGLSADNYPSVAALAVDRSGNLYAGGDFDRAGGLAALNIARWDGTRWLALGTGIQGNTQGNVSSYVKSLRVDDTGALYAGGYFQTAGGTPARRLARWNGTSWSGQGLALRGDSSTYFAEDVVNALALDSRGNLYVGGRFIRAGTVAANNIARLTLAATGWSAVGALPLAQGFGDEASIRSVVLDGRGNLYVGGDFDVVGNKAAKNVARWDGRSWSPLGPGLTGPYVTSLALDSRGTLYAGGYFSETGDVPVKSVAKWDGSTWQPLGASIGGLYVATLVIDRNDNLYVGGEFSQAGGLAARNVAKWNGTGWSAMGAGLPNPVYALALDGNGNLYAGGRYTTFNNRPVGDVYKWNGTSWAGLAPGLDGDVRALTIATDGTLYAGGGFYRIGGTDARNVARWDGSVWSALGTFPANPGLGSMDVRALSLDGRGGLYVGAFSTSGYGAKPTPMDRLAKWNGTTWTALGTGIEIDHSVWALAWTGSSLYVGGDFRTVGDSSKVMLGFGRFSPPSPPTLTSISPASGARGSTITLNGTNLAAATITFAGSGSPPVVNQGYSVNAAGTQITALVVPAGAVTGAVTVTTAGGTSNSLPFTVLFPPTLKSVNPIQSTVGGTVKLTGTYLSGTSLIRFAGTSNNTVSAGYTVSADGTELTGLVVPTGAQSGLVSVTTPSGTSNGIFLDIYVDPTPTITSLSPDRGPAGSSITITGTNLTGARVTFAGTSNNTVSTGYTVNAAGTQLTDVVVPAGATTGNVTVTTPNGTSNGLAFTVTLPLPALTSIAPTNGVVGSTVTLNGTNLAGTTSITFAGTSGNTVTSGFTVNPAGTQITGIIVPGGATTGNVRVTTPGGTSNGVVLNVVSTPIITILSPNRGPAGSSITITGTNLTGARVTFAGTSNNTVSTGFAVNATGTQLSGLIVPAGAQSGPLSVTTPGGTSNGLLFTLTTATATVPTTTGVLTLHPNPAHETVTVALPASLARGPLTLLDALGREVRRYPTPAGNDVTLDLRGLPAGLYVLRGSGVGSQRLVVE